MKKGQLIRVYKKPVSDRDCEGIAKIITVYPGDYDKELKLHLCKVRFENDEPAVCRRVKAANIVKEA